MNVTFFSGEFPLGTMTHDPRLRITMRNLELVDAHLSNLRPPLEAAVRIVAQEIKTNFISQGRPQKWEPLAENTTQHKGRAGKMILVDTGEMMDRSTDPSNWVIFPVNKSSWQAAMTEPTEYTEFHLTGTDRTPQRDFTFIPESAVEEIERVFEVFVSAQLEKYL